MSSRPRPLSRLIPKEQVEAVAQWRFGAVGEGADSDAPVHGVGQSDDDYRMAHEEGYAEGYDVGRLLGQREGQQRLDDYIRGQGRSVAQRMTQMLDNAQRGINDGNQRMAAQVLELACDIARQILRQELSVNPNALLPVIREALGMLATDSRAATVRLHPKDLEVLDEPLRTEFGHLDLHWVGDAGLRTGSCLVEAGGTTVDGTLERRWKRAVSSMGLDLDWDAGGDDDGA